MEKEDKQDVDLENNEEGEQKSTEEESEDDDSEDYRAKLNAQNRFLEKEGYKFENNKWVKPKPPVETKETKVVETEQKDNLSQKDLYVLLEAKVPSDDMDDVVRYAKFENITVKEALGRPVVKSILAEKAETRRTAEATNTGTSRRVTKTVTSEKLVSDLSEGKVPEKGTKEAEELFWTRRGGKK